MYFPSDHKTLVNFANSFNQKFDINVRDYEYLVILACESNRQDILNYILKSKSIPFNNERLSLLKTLEKNTKKNLKKQNEPCCFICIEPYNKSTRSIIKCQCDYECCKSCVKVYLLNQNQDPHCMNCKVSWDRKFMTDNFDIKFITTEYTKYRENILFERELVMMPQTQIYVDAQIEVEKLRQELDVLKKENEKINKKYNDEKMLICEKIDKLQNKDNTKTIRKAFVRQCPNGDCRGFLSSSLKCNICEKWACGKCREVKGDTREAEHECDIQTIESIKALDKEMKECPSCSYKISKIDGCFIKDTPMLMYDGSKKIVQDIKINDILVGDDGNKRIVKNLVSGTDEMYEIQQNNGENYIVNSKHTLVLKYSSDKSIYWYEKEQLWKIIWFCRKNMKRKTKNFKLTNLCNKDQAKQNAEIFKNTLTFPENIRILVSEYIKLDKWSKKYLMGFKSSNGINYEYQNVTLDPYLLGLWLGDGTLSRPCIASEDIEIQKYILNWCENNDAELIHEEGVQFRIRRKGLSNYKDCYRLSISHGLTSELCKGCNSKKMTICDLPNINNNSGLKTNPFTDLLKIYNLTKQKHIPSQYLQNTRNIRLKVLAGIIDTDGCVPEQNGKRVVIKLSDKKLFDDTVSLTRSLGFVVNTSMIERKNISIFGLPQQDYKDQYILNISGKLLNDIPTILPRKKCFSNNPIVDLYRTNIKVIHLGKDNYYGFEVDKNNLFVSPDFTVYKNCDQMYCTPEFGGCGTAFSWRTGNVETKIHNPHYFSYKKKLGQIERNPNEILCGREIDENFIFNISNTLKNHKISEFCRIIIHTRLVDLIKYTPRERNNGNLDLRISYMRNKINKDNLKLEIQKREFEDLKKKEVSNVIQMFINCMTDILYRLNDNHNLINEIIQEIENLRLYVNNCFLNISKSYKCTCWCYDKNLYLTSVTAIKRQENKRQEKNQEIEDCKLM